MFKINNEELQDAKDFLFEDLEVKYKNKKIAYKVTISYRKEDDA